MRVMLSHPTSWPAVRRGMERLFADLERWLSEEGHEVSTVTCRPSPPGTADRRTSSLPSPITRRLPDPSVTYQARIALAARRHSPHVLHGLHYLDGVGHALSGRARHATPLILHIPGIPHARALQWRPYHRALFGMSLHQASVVIAMSRAAASALSRDFGHTAMVLPNGVFTSKLATRAVEGVRAERPTVLFPGDATDPRKRVHLLAEALAILRGSVPGLRMVVAWPIDDAARFDLEQRSGVPVEVRNVASPEDMPALYAEAWVTCLPSVDEAFGLVYVESLACGTPAVGVRDGGVPEVISESAWIADPDDAADLARTLRRALEDSLLEGSAEHARQMAEPFDWSVVGPRLIGIYEEAMGAMGGTRSFFEART